jgi:hypothetical protein
MAKSSRKAEQAIPVSEEPVSIDIKASADAGGEGSDVQPAAEAGQGPDADRLVVDDPHYVDYEERRAFNALRAIEGEMGAALHAVHMRLVEMLPFLDSAVAQADGELKQFLADLMADLTS